MYQSTKKKTNHFKLRRQSVLLLQQSGMAIFYFRMRINGIDTKKNIGSYPDISLKEARVHTT